MKKLVFTLSILALTVLMVGNVFAQTPKYNEGWLVYEKSAFIATTANDTTTWINLTDSRLGAKSGALDVTVFGRANDSTTIRIMYQLKNSVTNWTGAWTEVDTCILTDDQNSATYDSTANVGTIALATLAGVDQIRFYRDYLTGTSAISLADGTANRFRQYVFIRKVSGQ